MVKVFYGTDRAVKGPADSARIVMAGWLKWTLYGAGLTMILAVVALRLYRTAPMRILAWASGSATVVLGIWTAYLGVQHAMERPPSDRPKLAYGNQRGNRLQLGTCRVSIPKDHRVGEVESPSILRLEFREDPERHVVLLDVLSKPADEFYGELKDCVEKSSHCGAFVFVHGFNVTFEDAARRTAQIAYDLKFDGAPIFYSWPSQGSLSGYTVDEATVKVTARHLKQFLLGVARQTGNRRIHLIAHSMGNRALTSALRDLSFLDDQTRPKFHEVVLTAPDIDADLFKNDIAPAIVKTAGRVTLYASSNDKALVYSKQVHGYPRAGDSGNSLLVIPGIDTIDVSAVDTSLLGHSYYGSNDTVLADLFDLLHGGKKPDERKWLRAEAFGALKYWVFQSAMTAAREPSPAAEHSSTHIH